MANAYRVSSNLWEVTETGTLVSISAAAHIDPAWVKKIYYVPNATGDTVTFQTGDSENAIVVKANSGDTNAVEVNFPGRGRRVRGLTCSGISASSTAYVYL